MHKIKRPMLVSLHSLWVFLLVSLMGFSQELPKVNIETYIYKDTLALDFYTMRKGVEVNRPLVVLVHGGGFSFGKRDNETEVEFCESLARHGYSVASISYRLTRKNESFGCDCPAETKIETFVQASEDLTTAIDFLTSNEKLNFDRQKVVLVGSSAGAETVLNTAFMNNHYDFKHLKSFSYAGVISFAGAMIDTNYIVEDNAIPVLLFHGKKDKLVPFDTAAHHYCPVKTKGYLILHGSNSISERIETLGISFVLAFDPDGTHSWANEAYKHTNLIEGFIDEIILGEKYIQNRVIVKPLIKEVVKSEN